MKSIKIISNLKLSHKGLECEDNCGKYREIGLLQGSMDGACAVYSLFMNLLIIKKISFADLDLYRNSEDRSTRKLCKELFENKGMHYYGNTFGSIQRTINGLFKDYVKAYHPKKRNADVIPIIQQTIERDLPVIISIDFDIKNEMGHALLCVGYELSKNKISKLFCLDPSSNSIYNSYWNAVIDINPNTNRRKYSCQYLLDEKNDNEAYLDVALGDILIVEPI